jgi:hypothetical protein
MAPGEAAPRIVRTQAHTMRGVMSERTPVKRGNSPAPTMAPAMVCLVLTGMPKCTVPISVNAPAAFAAKTLKGFSFVMRCPMVLTMRHRPASVPPPIAR